MKPKENIPVEELLRHIAFQQAAAASSFRNGCRVVHLPEASWEIKAIEAASFVLVARTADELRSALGQPNNTFILIPSDAMISKAMLDREIGDCVLNKTVICEGEL